MKFKSIRCNNDQPTPYLRQHIHELDLPPKANVLDLGCGNGRNSKFLKRLGFNVESFDKKPDYGSALDLAYDKIPPGPWPDLILCNYVLCFMNPNERQHLANEICRVSLVGCFLMVELYAAKAAYPYKTEDIRNMFPKSEWETRHIARDRFILKRVR